MKASSDGIICKRERQCPTRRCGMTVSSWNHANSCSHDMYSTMQSFMLIKIGTDVNPNKLAFSDDLRQLTIVFVKQSVNVQS